MQTSDLTFKKKLVSFYRLILRRPVPHTLASWRFLAPGPSLAVKMHRTVFLKAWGQLPRWAWCLIFCYSQCLWLFFLSWKRIIMALRRHAGETQRRFHISPVRQTVDLWVLSWLHGIPPGFYYAYGLHRQPRRRWLHYVYTHELPHWHEVMCGPGDLSAANRLLADKNAFAEEMTRAGIPAVKTIAFFRQAGPVNPEKIFTGQSFFWKPNTGNQSQGCFALLYECAVKDYRVDGEEAVAGKDAVLGYVQRQVADQDYLVQPLLLNHPEVRGLGSADRLTTVRLITGHDGRQPGATAAVLEMPRPDAEKRWWLAPVDCRRGTLLPRPGVLSLLKEEDLRPDLGGKVIPCWQETLDLCLRAHELFPEVAAIGWDVALTPDGPVLLEGNFNWNVAPWQALSGVPLLETGLLRIYASRLWPGSSP